MRIESGRVELYVQCWMRHIGIWFGGEARRIVGETEGEE